jgi:hypothetical protein
MGRAVKLDNGSYRQKVLIRQAAVKQLAEPVIMETHGGTGQLFRACYAGCPRGVVFDKDGDKVDVLARQRPTWAVYQADCVQAIAAGAGGHLAVDLLDVDPYGDPWPAIRAFFESKRPRPARVAVVVHDGVLPRLRLMGASGVGSLAEMGKRYGDKIAPFYLEVCRELVAGIAAPGGYGVTQWAGFYSGKSGQNTHWLAILEKETAPPGDGAGDRTGPATGAGPGPA